MMTTPPPYPSEPYAPPRVAPWRHYHDLTRTATYGFLAALPLLFIYEMMIMLVNNGNAYAVRISAEVWLKRMLGHFGLAGMHILGLVVFLVGVAIFYYERRRDIPVRPRYFGGIMAESSVYAIVLALLISSFVGFLFAMAPVLEPALFAAAPQHAEPNVWMRLTLSIGAGIYEELFFRVLLVGGLYMALKWVLPKAVYAYVIAAVVGAFLFSAVHYFGSLGDDFTFASFTFRFLFGLSLNAVFLLRGFGVAAWTHALYDVMVVTHFFG